MAAEPELACYLKIALLDHKGFESVSFYTQILLTDDQEFLKQTLITLVANVLCVMFMFTLVANVLCVMSNQPQLTYVWLYNLIYG